MLSMPVDYSQQNSCILLSVSSIPPSLTKVASKAASLLAQYISPFHIITWVV